MSKSEIKKLDTISIKKVGYSKKELRALTEKSNEAVFVARVGGVVAEKFHGEGQHGEWTGFKGIFSLINEKGEKYQAMTAFLPANITARIVEQLNQGVVDVQFTADIFVVPSDKSGTDYAYMCEPVLSEEAEKKMHKISDSVFGGKLPSAKALPAPKAKAQDKNAA